MTHTIQNSINDAGTFKTVKGAVLEFFKLISGKTQANWSLEV